MPSADRNAGDSEAPAARAAARQGRDPQPDEPGPKPAFFDWLCRMGDTTLILSHRLSQWCGHAPALEEDIALANIALDLIGHTRMWLGLAGEIEGEGRSADDLVFLRDAMKFRNLLLAELPRGDMAQTLMRQFLFDVWHYELLLRLSESSNPRVAEIAAKAVKEVSYHRDRSTDLVIRLGDGTEHSRRRMQHALERLWRYCGEMFLADDIDQTLAAARIAPRPDALLTPWRTLVEDVLEEATLIVPEDGLFTHSGGRAGRHTEHLGYILAEMQFLQRAYPGVSW